MGGFVFYDTETTGLNIFHDQILQFGAIRTDVELNELERFELKCRIQPHIVPSPTALLINGTSVRDLSDPSRLSHYEMAIQIQEIFQRWSPAVFVGWNSIKFDENLVRQMFFQTLHDPYLTNTGGNVRTDALTIARTAALLNSNSIKVPRDESGNLRFKLGSGPINL